MKKILTIILVTILIGTGCTTEKEIIKDQEVDDELTNSEVLKDEVSNDKVKNIESSIVGISEIPDFKLPDNIHESQLKKVFKWEDKYFVTVIKQVFWYPLPLPEEIARPYFSGILVAKEGDEKWEIFVEIKNNPSRNIPLYLWNEGDTLFMPIEDGNGGGSGEGILKLLESSDFGKTWETAGCYYAAGTDLDKYTKHSVYSHAAALEQNNNTLDNTNLDPGHGYFMLEQQLDNPSCNNFIIDSSITKPDESPESFSDYMIEYKKNNVVEELEHYSMDFEGDGINEEVLYYKSTDDIGNEELRINRHLDVYKLVDGKWTTIKEDIAAITNAAVDSDIVSVEVVDLGNNGEQEIFVEKRGGKNLKYYIFGFQNGEYIDLPIPKGYIRSDEYLQEREAQLLFMGVSVDSTGVNEYYNVICENTNIPMVEINTDQAACRQFNLFLEYRNGEFYPSVI